MRNLIHIILPSVMLLSGCEVQSRVQGQYIDMQGTCRTQAEANVAAIPNVARLTQDQQGAAMVNAYSKCMNQAGWRVANPLKARGGTTEAGAGVPPTAVNAATSAPAPASQQPVDAAQPGRYQPQPASNAPQVPPVESRPGRQF